MGADGGVYIWHPDTIREQWPRLRHLVADVRRTAKERKWSTWDKKQTVSERDVADLKAAASKLARLAKGPPDPSGLVRAVPYLYAYERPLCLVIGYGTNLGDEHSFWSEALWEAIKPDVVQETWT